MSGFHDSFEIDGEDILAVLNLIAAGVGVSGESIFRQNEQAVTTKVDTDLTSTTYTVPAGKEFRITSFNASYDATTKIDVMIKKQDLGSGPFNTIFKMVMLSGGQGDATLSMHFGAGIKVGIATDVFKIVYNAAVRKGTIWGAYAGIEV